ncbi:group III truncated hemoglobin [Breoghania sp. JC706]|uniref:group III truncated hemoglobin n=1 Tax=Breoghania sp. JC706 TaxID=3117732 RepID=UPI00300876A4
MTELDIRPAVSRTPAHPSITRAQISALVDTFYGRIQADERLGPVFAGRIADWGPHLAKMKHFWASVLLKTGEYKGKPVPTHFVMKEVEAEDFGIWLTHFRAVAREIFEPEAAPIVINHAERIATSLWMAMFATPFDKAPDYLRS